MGYRSRAIGKLVHSGPRSSRQGARRSTMVRCREAILHSTRTWWRACLGTRAAHQRCTCAMSNSGRAIGSPAVGGCVVERIECRVEPLLPAPVRFMIGFGRHGPDQLVQVLVGGGQDGAVVLGADAEDESFAVWVQQLQIA